MTDVARPSSQLQNRRRVVDPQRFQPDGGTVTWPRDLPRPEHEFTAEAASPEATLAQSLAPANAECPPLLRPDLAPGPIRFPGSFLCCTHVLDVRLFGVARVNGLPFEHAFDTVQPSLEIRSQDRYLGHDFFFGIHGQFPPLHCSADLPDLFGRPTVGERLRQTRQGAFGRPMTAGPGSFAIERDGPVSSLQFDSRREG